MKKSASKKVLAILITFALVIGLNPVSFVGSAIGNVPGENYTQKHFVDDFDSVTSMSHWNTSGISTQVLPAELPYRTPEDLNASPEDINNVMMPAYRTTAESMATVLDHSVLPSGKIMSYSMQMKAIATSGWSIALVSYADAAGNYAYADFNFSEVNTNYSAAVLTSRGSKKGTNIITASPTGKYLTNATTAFAISPLNYWINVEMIYDYSKIVSNRQLLITYKVTGNSLISGHTTDTVQQTFTYTFGTDPNTGLSTYDPNFSIGFFNGTTHNILLDNAVVKTESSLALEGAEIDEAEAFVSDNSTILNKNVQDCTIKNDTTAYLAAIDDYNLLSTDVKAWLVAEKAHLDAIYQKFTTDIHTNFYDGFDNTSFSSTYWTTAGTKTTDYSFDTDGTVNYMKPSVHTTGYSAFTYVNNNTWPVGKPSTLSMRFKVNSDYGWINRSMLFYFDPSNNAYAGLEFNNNNGVLACRAAAGNGATQTGMSDEIPTDPLIYFYNQWITVEAVYDYTYFNDTTRKVIINYTVKLENGNTWFTPTMTVTIPTNASQKVHYAQTNDQASGRTMLDYVEINTLYQTDQDKADIFCNKHADILSRNTNSLQDGDTALHTAAMTDYNNLTSAVQAILVADGTKSKLDDLAIALGIFIESRADNDFSDFNENFENTMFRWSTTTSGASPTSDFQIVTDPNDSSNKVLYSRTNGAFLAPNSKLWPKYGAMTNVSFRMKLTSLTGNPQNRNRIFSSFTDSDNYNSMVFNQLVNTQTSGMLDGNAQGGNWVGPYTFSPTGWFNVSIVYSGRNATITMTDQNNRTATSTMTLNYLNGTVAFGTPYASGWIAEPVWIDDINVQFTKGNFDVNDNIKDIEVYYTGNTFVKPGETVLIQGENLGNTVDSAYIMRLDDTSNPTTVSYIGEQSFKQLAPSGASTATWNDATAQAVTFTQKTPKSLKFIIPSTWQQGVYAVKLVAKNAGSQNKTLYINDPEINFAIGNEGETATPGGTIRIIGSNLVPSGIMSDVKVALRDTSNQVTFATVTEIQNNDAYSVKASIPSNLASGTYQVFVHSGYGDDTAWSEPATIKVGTSPRSSWPTTVFNVLDYGATGNGLVNDTPAIISALTAANANGGGVVYLPRGVYRALSTIAIPEKVVFKGDGKDASTIIWIATGWNYGAVPDSLITFTGNVEIYDLGFHGTRFHTIFQNYKTTPTSNINLHDLRLQFYPFVGSPTGGTGASTGKLTPAEMVTQISAEMNGGSIYKFNGEVSNLQLKNIASSFSESLTSSSTYGLCGNFKYMQISGCNFNDRWSPFTSYYAGILENCDYSNACLGLSGNFYMARNNLHDLKGNNRELYTSDGRNRIDGTTVRFVGPIEQIMGQGNTDEVTYMFMNTTQAQNSLVGNEIFVVSGQGTGQVRKIVSNTYNTITIDKPFAVAPNRNSLVSISYPKTGSYFVGNTFENGAASGTYGTLIDSVFDGNQYIRHGGQTFNVYQGVLWYVSTINGILKDPFYMQGDGETSTSGDNTGIGKWQLVFNQGTRAYASMGFLFKNNQMLNGSYLSISWYGNSSPGTQDIIIEKNLFNGGNVGIVSNTVTSNVGDGVLLKDNTYNSITKCSTTLASALNSNTYLNKLGQQRFIEINPTVNGSGTLPSAITENGFTAISNTTNDQYTVGSQLWSDTSSSITSQFTSNGYYTSGTQAWTDYTTSVNLTFPTNYVTTNSNTVQLWQRHSEIAQYGYCDYGIILTTIGGVKKLQIATRSEKTTYNATYTVLTDVTFDYLSNPGTAHALRTDIVDNRILVYWDGQFILGCADTSRLKNLRGSVGLYISNCTVTLDNLLVKQLVDPVGGDFDNKIGGNFTSAVPAYLQEYITNNWCY